MSDNDMTLEEYAAFLATMSSLLIVEPARIVLTGMIDNINSALKSEVPVLSSRLKESITPYVGDPPLSGDPSFFSSSSVPASIMEAWEPGEEVGVISAIPYSGRLLLGGHSKKFPEGRLDLLIEEKTNVSDAIVRGNQLLGDSEK